MRAIVVKFTLETVQVKRVTQDGFYNRIIFSPVYTARSCGEFYTQGRVTIVPLHVWSSFQIKQVSPTQSKY